MRNASGALLLLVACATAAPQPAPPPVNGPKLVPLYDWDKDKTLTAFHQQMMEVIEARDEKRLFDHVDPDVQISFGSGNGIEAFKQAWYQHPLWGVLYTIFYEGGGALRDDGHFWTPSVYANWPEQYDASSFVAVIRRSTLMHEANDPKSNAIATLSYDIVKPLGGPGHIRVADGRTGWVDPRALWSPLGYRIGLTRKWGTWKITTFVAGD